MAAGKELIKPIADEIPVGSALNAAETPVANIKDAETSVANIKAAETRVENVLNGVSYNAIYDIKAAETPVEKVLSESLGAGTPVEKVLGLPFCSEVPAGKELELKAPAISSVTGALENELNIKINDIDHDIKDSGQMAHNALKTPANESVLGSILGDNQESNYSENNTMNIMCDNASHLKDFKINCVNNVIDIYIYKHMILNGCGINYILTFRRVILILNTYIKCIMKVLMMYMVNMMIVNALICSIVMNNLTRNIETSSISIITNNGINPNYDYSGNNNKDDDGRDDEFGDDGFEDEKGDRIQFKSRTADTKVKNGLLDDETGIDFIINKNIHNYCCNYLRCNEFGNITSSTDNYVLLWNINNNTRTQEHQHKCANLKNNNNTILYGTGSDNTIKIISSGKILNMYENINC
eukprot:140020_1